MRTYLRQSRVFFIETIGGVLSFPNDVELEMVLQPEELFGVGTGLNSCRTFLLNSEVRLFWNANIGRTSAYLHSPGEPVDLKWQNNGLVINVVGNRVQVRTSVEDRGELVALISTLHLILPTFLCVGFLDAPYFEQLTGKVGSTSFTWQFEHSDRQFETITTEERDERIIAALDMVLPVGRTKSRRLALALHYFYVSCRLSDVGVSPWEFMAESILNLSKVLGILFVSGQNSMDDVRLELVKLGYSSDEIEGAFIPIMVLRSSFDVAHVAMSLPMRDELDAIYAYLGEIQHTFRSLLKQVIVQILEGKYQLKEDAEIELDPDKKTKVSRMLRYWSERKRPT